MAVLEVTAIIDDDGIRQHHWLHETKMGAMSRIIYILDSVIDAMDDDSESWKISIENNKRRIKVSDISGRYELLVPTNLYDSFKIKVRRKNIYR